MDVAAVRVTGLSQKLFGLLGIVRIPFELGIGTEDIGAHRAIDRVTDTVEYILDNGRGIHGIVDSLANELIIERFVSDIESQKKHPEPFDLLDFDARMALQPRHFMDRYVVDEVRLA